MYACLSLFFSVFSASNHRWTRAFPNQALAATEYPQD